MDPLATGAPSHTLLECQQACRQNSACEAVAFHHEGLQYYYKCYILDNAPSSGDLCDGRKWGGWTLYTLLVN